jgi:hypothetical protein
LKRIGDSISQETIISNIERPEDADLTDPTDLQGVFTVKRRTKTHKDTLDNSLVTVVC